MGKSVVAFQNQTHIRVFWFRHVRVDQREGEGEGFINANESLALKSLFRPHDLSLHVYIDGKFLGGELVHVFQEGPHNCSTYALDSGGLKKWHPHHEKTSCFVKVCVCVWYDKARPLSSPMWCPNSSNISPIVRVVSSMDGQPQRSKGEKGESCSPRLRRVKFLAKPNNDGILINGWMR